MALSLVYCIPEDALNNQLLESKDILEEEGIKPISYTTGKKYDNFTVAIMLSEAAVCSGNPVLNAIQSNYYSDNDKVFALEKSINGETNQNYARYWHGYLVYLKPLLVFFNLRQIATLFQAITAVLLISIAVLLYKKLKLSGFYFAIALAFSATLLSIFDASATLPFFVSICISLLGILLVLKIDIENQKTIRAFFS